MNEPVPRLTRRSAIAAPLGLALAARVAVAQMPAAPSPLSPERLRLWPGEPPGGRDGPALVPTRSPEGFLRGIAVPELAVYRPATPNGAAALIAPGGGYGFVSAIGEGSEQAAWLTRLGVTAFVLHYRLPGEGWRDRRDVPLQDAQRAARLIRARASDYRIDPDGLLAIGFSAGGHVMGSLATRHAERIYAPVDAADRLSARPAAAALIYPVITFGPQHSHGGSRDNLLGTGIDAATIARYSIDSRVGSDTPPVFLMQTNDDTTVPVENSIIMWQAMRAARRTCDLHLFARGGHGFGVRLPADNPASSWPRLLADFARAQGVFPARAVPLR